MHKLYCCVLLLLFSFSTDIRAEHNNVGAYLHSKVNPSSKSIIAKKKKKKQKATKQAGHIPKIYDCFTFFNEMELLEIRLNELDEAVDYFVLVEMDETFQGAPKPLLFKKNRKRFEKFLHKIIYVGVTERIEVHNNPWEREKFQRDQIMRALHRCNDNDVILVSDLDEILSHQAIPQIVEALNHHSIVACHLAFFSHFLNSKERSNGGARPFAMRYSRLKNKSIDDLRKRYIFNIPSPPPNPPYIVEDAGWHFSWMGGLDRLVQKLDAWSHTPENTPTITPEWRTQTFIDGCVANSDIIEIDQSYPQFVLEHFDELREAGFIYTPPSS
jgi:beta-1,4-mannosyl-glycoprotein beta-1,4-N-acetylglucosaminyltransferase